MNVAIGADHGGYPLKQSIIDLVSAMPHRVLDVGAHQFDAQDDYPDFALAVAQAVASGQAQRGIIICGSGVGAAVAANKVTGIRACLCHDTYSAHQGVEHDDLNVLCLGARIVGAALAEELVRAFLHAQFSGEPRHCRRLEKVKAMEESQK